MEVLQEHRKKQVVTALKKENQGRIQPMRFTKDSRPQRLNVRRPDVNTMKNVSAMQVKSAWKAARPVIVVTQNVQPLRVVVNSVRKRKKIK